MFNHTSVLLLGGYTISSAFSRSQIELRLAAYLQKKLGHEPKYFILAVMMLGLTLSTLISNTTAPILCSAIITPIVRDINYDSKFSKCLLLGLAIACNFGGMMTPIASVQNALAVSTLENVSSSSYFILFLLIHYYIIIIIIIRLDTMFLLADGFALHCHFVF